MLKNKKGETFIETLISLLILVIVITGFTTIIASTAKLNKVVKESRISFNDSERQVSDGWTVYIEGINSTEMLTRSYDKYSQTTAPSGEVTTNKGIIGYNDGEEDLYYYEYKK